MSAAANSPLLPDANPFATRWVRPGALEFVFGTGDGCAALIERLRTHGWWGQIVGPHGSGKSTLLRNVIPELQAARRAVDLVELHQGERWFALTPRSASWTAATVVIVDGYEQLNWWSRGRLKRQCRARGAGLLVTTHRDAGFPTILQTSPSLELAQMLVKRLLAQSPPLITEADVVECWSATRGNLRELLFALYDRYESQRVRHSRAAT